MKEYQIRKLWIEEINRWVYFITYKGLLFVHRVKRESGNYYTDRNTGRRIENINNNVMYFSTEEEASDYVIKNFSKENNIVRIIQIS